jgi:hypothetical protein
VDAEDEIATGIDLIDPDSDPEMDRFREKTVRASGF